MRKREACVCASRHVVGSVFVNLGGLSEASIVTAREYWRHDPSTNIATTRRARGMALAQCLFHGGPKHTISYMCEHFQVCFVCVRYSVATHEMSR